MRRKGKRHMRSLLIVDVQNDFCSGGALEVPDGELIVPLVNLLQPHFDLVVTTQDWHPADHKSFAVMHQGKSPGDIVAINGIEQILWPVHCVEGSFGAEFHKNLDRTRVKRNFHKGTNRDIDSYSAFFDNAHLRATGLGDYLREQGVKDLFICGLATDYCVKFSTLDAAKLGFATHVVEDACRGVNLKPGDVRRALGEMKDSGVKITRSHELAG